MTTEVTPKERILEVLEGSATAEASVPSGLVAKIYEHEHAVQFDEKRYEASAYIRGLVIEYLNGGD